MIDSTDDNERFYTYIYYDPSRNNEPIYVGKGCRGRYVDHIKMMNKGKRHPFIQRLEFMQKNNTTPIIGVYAGLDEEIALFLEEELILKFRLKSQGGTLLNLKTTGNIAPAGGWKLSEETKNRMRAAHRGKKGTPHTDKAKIKISEALKGRKHSEETKEKIRAGNLGKKKVISDKARENLSRALKGKPKSDEWKEKMREINRIKRKNKQNDN